MIVFLLYRPHVMVVKSCTFNKPTKFQTTTNLSPLDTELYYQENQLLIRFKSQKSPQLNVTGFDYFSPFELLECLGWSLEDDPW